MNTKALRQKILDLAIRGKLVPQDPNDEPASVLLERIRAEKQQMVKDGKLKAKDIKNDTVIFLGDDNLHYEKFPDGTVKCIEDEIPFELPEGWEWCRLSTISQYISDGDHQPPPQTDDGIPFLVISNVSNGFLDFTSTRYVSPDYYNGIAEYRKPCKGDLLFTVTGSYGIPVLVNENKPFCFQRHIAIIRPIIISNSFLSYELGTSYIKTICDNQSTGTAQKTVGLATLRSFILPIPPITEQQRIESKIKELLLLTDNIESDKTDLQTTIQLTKSKILDLAIKGKLVPQNPDDEPASVLLDRIRAEKEELIKQGKIKRDKKESVIYKGDDNSYYGDIPDNWEVASISQLNYYQSSSVNPLLFPDEYFELFSVPNYDIGIPEIVKGNEIGSTKQSVESKDVLLCKINPRINRVWTVTCVTEYKTIASSEWIVFRNPFLYSPYVTIYLSSPLFRELLLTNVSGVGGSLMRAQPDSVKKYPVVIPPYEEQKRIADKVSQLFSLLDSIAENVS